MEEQIILLGQRSFTGEFPPQREFGASIRKAPHFGIRLTIKFAASNVIGDSAFLHGADGSLIAARGDPLSHVRSAASPTRLMSVKVAKAEEVAPKASKRVLNLGVDLGRNETYCGSGVMVDAGSAGGRLCRPRW